MFDDTMASYGRSEKVMSYIYYDEEILESTDNFNLYSQSWRSTNSVAVVVVVHGYAEHSGRYQWAALKLVDRGFAFYTFDLRGHGRSLGARNIMPSFDDYLADLATFLERVKLKEPNKPIFLFGHSMGGTIAALFAIRQKPLISGLILSSAILVNRDISTLLLRTTILVGHLLPKFPILSLDSQMISRNPKVIKIYEADSLVYHGRMPARTLLGIIRAIVEIQSRANELELPLLILHGTEDRLVSIEGSKILYSYVSSKDKSIELYDGLYHELLNEPERVQILSDIELWLSNHLPIS
jgi:acylglycerol lipase